MKRYIGAVTGVVLLAAMLSGPVKSVLPSSSYILPDVSQSYDSLNSQKKYTFVTNMFEVSDPHREALDASAMLEQNAFWGLESFLQDCYPGMTNMLFHDGSDGYLVAGEPGKEATILPVNVERNSVHIPLLEETVIYIELESTQPHSLDLVDMMSYTSVAAPRTLNQDMIIYNPELLREESDKLGEGAYGPHRILDTRPPLGDMLAEYRHGKSDEEAYRELVDLVRVHEATHIHDIREARTPRTYGTCTMHSSFYSPTMLEARAMLTGMAHKPTLGMASMLTSYVSEVDGEHKAAAAVIVDMFSEYAGQQMSVDDLAGMPTSEIEQASMYAWEALSAYP